MTIYIAVDNTAPVAPSAVAGSPGDVIDGGTINEDTSTVLDLSILITDAEGDNVTYTFTDPANGTLSLSGTDLTYSPDPDYPYAVKPDDTDSFTLTVSDMPGSENSYTVNVTVTHVNDPPVAYDDSGWVSSSFTATIPLVGTDIDGDSPLFYSIVGAPTKGTLGAVTGNQVDYTSFYGAWGIDTFTYVVNDGSLDSNVATVTVQIRLPDLTVTITSLPSSILVGGNFVLSFTVTNRGGGASPATSVGPWIANVASTWSDIWAPVSVPELAPGQSYSDSLFLNLTYVPLIPDTYYMGLDVDYFGLVVEENEGNNSAWRTFWAY